MGLQDLITLLEKFFGIKGGIITTLCIFIFILYKTKLIGKLFNKISEKYIEYFMSKTGKSVVMDISESDITNHDIFNYIDFWLYSKIPAFQFSTQYRTIVFRKYLSIYLKKYKDDLSSYINSKSYLEMDDSELWKSFLALINNIVYDYEREMESVGIPKIILEKMKDKNNDTIQLTIDLIEGICNSQFYKSESNYLKVYSILNILLSILENTITKSQGVCNSINGQLRNFTFTEQGTVFIEP